MGVRLASVSSNTLQNTVITANTETVILTSPPINLTLDNALVLIFWQLSFSVGTGVTNFAAKLRRGTAITGTLINVLHNVSTTASFNDFHAGVYQDTPGVVAGQQWSLTITQTAATGNGTAIDGCIAAVVL